MTRAKIMRARACRVDLFDATSGWQAHNPCPIMGARMARLPGQGSFCFPGPRAAWRAARVAIARGQATAARVVTISDVWIGYMRRDGRAYAYESGDR